MDLAACVGIGVGIGVGIVSSVWMCVTDRYHGVRDPPPGSGIGADLVAGPLTPQEWAFIHHAPAIGERITLSAPALAAAAPLVRAARERYDGTGYPDGLAGDEIPLGARIITACAALAAMTSDRPHADRLDTTTALDELTQAAGTQFHPQVVTALRQAVLHPATT